MENELDIAVLFEPDGYVLEGPKLMGRQSAGNSFLRALLNHSGGRRVWAYSPNERSGKVFSELAKEINPSVDARWLSPSDFPSLKKIDGLFLPGPNLLDTGNYRLRVGPRAYSLVGLTHTTASHRSMQSICDLLTAPVFPWDALICTSHAVQSTVRTVLERQAEYLRWRLNAGRLDIPKLPLIPLGVHSEDYEFSPQQKAESRRALGIENDEIVVLYVGRLSFHAKAHPHAMFAALNGAANKLKKKIVLIQCGWFTNDNIEKAFKQGAEDFGENVRMIWTDGRELEQRTNSWASAEIFISLSDNIQETFGLTPIEAMAAGIPVLATDWNGYRDTVRDGVDGFLIPTWMPVAPHGEAFAARHEAGIDTYDNYSGLTCQTISVDYRALANALERLLTDEDLRRDMGERGRQRVQSEYDWSVIINRYFALWQELTEIRTHHPGLYSEGAPACGPARMDPYRLFESYPTHAIEPHTLVSFTGVGQSLATIANHPLFSYAGRGLPPAGQLRSVLEASKKAAETSVLELSEKAGVTLESTVMAVAWLAKTGFVRFSNEQDDV